MPSAHTRFGGEEGEREQTERAEEEERDEHLDHRRGEAEAYDDRRGSLIGNAYNPLVLAFLIGQLMVQVGLVQAPGVSVSDLAQRCVRLAPGARSSEQEHADAACAPALPWAG